MNASLRLEQRKLPSARQPLFVGRSANSPEISQKNPKKPRKRKEALSGCCSCQKSTALKSLHFTSCENLPHMFCMI